MNETILISELFEIGKFLKKNMNIKFRQTYKGYKIYHQGAISNEKLSWESFSPKEQIIGWKINNQRGIFMMASEETIIKESHIIWFDMIAALEMSEQPINILFYFVQGNDGYRLATEKLSEEEKSKITLDNYDEIPTICKFEPVDLEILKRKYFEKTLGTAKDRLNGMNEKIELCYSNTCYDYLRSIFSHKFDTEFFGIITLDQKDFLINTHVIHIGAITQEKLLGIIETIKYNTIVTDKASKYAAFHIFPPKKIYPDFIDINLAQTLKFLGLSKDTEHVPIVEYINIGKKDYISFADQGLVKDEFEEFVERFRYAMEEHGIKGELILDI